MEGSGQAESRTAEVERAPFEVRLAAAREHARRTNEPVIIKLSPEEREAVMEQYAFRKGAYERQSIFSPWRSPSDTEPDLIYTSVLDAEDSDAYRVEVLPEGAREEHAALSAFLAGEPRD